jgi:uridine kinase
MTRLARRLRPVGVAVAAGVAAGLAAGGSVSTSRPAAPGHHPPSGARATRAPRCAACTLEGSSATNSRPLVLGLAGCTASGKSTLCDAIVKRQGGGAVAVVTLDDFWMEESRLPSLPDDWLANNPNMARLKQHDTNIPESVDWAAAEEHICEVIASAMSSQIIIIEGFLLFSQPQLIALLDRTIYLTVDDAEKEVLMMRKYRRSGHFGKPSYESRGITVEEYTRYWDECVIDRFQSYGSRRPPGTIDLPCTMATAQQVQRLAMEIPLAALTHQLD